MPDINNAYSWAIRTCNAPNIGYSQAYRNQQTVGGITYYDCSSFINYALLAGGWETPSYAPSHNSFTTYTMPAELLRLGFTEVSATGEYKAGDIGLSEEHTEMCYKGGQGKGVFMGAHTDEASLDGQVSIGSSSGNTNYERSFPRLFRFGEGGATGYGASEYVVSALAGNAWRESAINPTVSQLGGGAFGMFQWDGSRREALFKWLSENGYEKTSPIGQMQYLIVENGWLGTCNGISSIQEFISSSSTNVKQLTEAFCNCWERPGVPALEERVEFAFDALEYILKHKDDESIKAWETEPMYYLSRNQSLHNAVLMYRYYSAGGEGGAHIKERKKMPIWMRVRYR